MSIYYHLDRTRLLQPGLLTLTKFDDITPPVLQEHVNLLFPTGVARHGDRYFLNSNLKSTETEPYLELVCEHVRRHRYPNKPSPLQRHFAFSDHSRVVCPHLPMLPPHPPPQPSPTCRVRTFRRQRESQSSTHPYRTQRRLVIQTINRVWRNSPSRGPLSPFGGANLSFDAERLPDEERASASRCNATGKNRLLVIAPLSGRPSPV